MVKVFVEYKIKPDKREQYLHSVKEIQRRMEQGGASHFSLYEGSDQPDLFVEMFDVPSIEIYYLLKEERSMQPVIDDCIAGGAAKIHIWAFEPVALAQTGEGEQQHEEQHDVRSRGE